ncbi:MULTISPECIES: PilW family protein [unclassified Lysobacter]|uniref:PilW family protein n=1 Tax=unclassified Lysobacter TaxID=2635362 RepID=UPI001BE9F3E0|nr:PilW family protein [Lysobacter sp. ISL-42]MBT2777008.1 PilW family protein [Lysobacter sp. ISL-54]MBT2781528.1 PilW family protein [Lysobacter sp. ISL-52]
MSRRLQAGLSLIELMVALLLSTLLVLGLIQIFSTSRASYQMAQGLARAQESSRFAIDALQRDARMSGHFGCVSDQAHFYAGNGMFGELFLTKRDDYNSMPATNEPLRFDYSIRGYEAAGTAPTNTLNLSTAPAEGAAGDWSPALTTQFFAALNPTPIRGSDIVVLRSLSPESVEVTGFTTGNPATILANAAQWHVLTTTTDKPGLFGIADCRSAVMFQATKIQDVGGAKQITVENKGLNQIAFDGSDTFAKGQARLYRAESLVYYVGFKLPKKTRPEDNELVLYRARFNALPGADALSLDADTGIAEEVVEGVENMQLLYGQDTVTDPAQSPTGVIDSVRTAATLLPNSSSSGGWQRVGEMQVGLLIRSTDPASAQKRTVVQRSLGTQLTLPDDKRYRTVYETNIALRNRLYGN